MTALYWLPVEENWRPALKALPAEPGAAWVAARALANTRLDTTRTNQLDEVLRRVLGDAVPKLGTRPVRLAILGSCTTAQLAPAIRLAALRRDIFVSVYEAEYGQYWQELEDTESGLHAFKPNVILFALDGYHLAAGVNGTMGPEAAADMTKEIQARITGCWRLAKQHFDCPVIMQTPLPVHISVMGNNEHRLPGSKAGFITTLNAALRPLADAAGVEILAIDSAVAKDGLAAWHDPVMWHRAKQEIVPKAAPMYGELVGRILGALQGKSFKCLVLDLDNTVWGGVVGDDGLEGLVLGQGSTLGEAFVAFQDYARELSRRGVILAVCSKNDETNALEPFEKHPEMILRRGDIACFVANWMNKADNLRSIAQQLNIGIDSLVFVDDNPFERNLVRGELPMVAVPEVNDDPATYAQTVSDAGYFESTVISAEDRERTAQYQSNRLRDSLKETATDLPTYLRSLEMKLIYRPFDAIGLSRTVQLINKTNQFNLRTQRYTESEVQAVMASPTQFGLQLRLTDRFGDNGIIAIVIGKLGEDGDLLIDTWLMSCRVLGRQVEQATLNLVAQEAMKLGAKRLVGEYLPTAKNGMVKDHYERLGFAPVSREADGSSRAVLDLAEFVPAEIFIEMVEG
jgi:FkbH-like protein